ncbi:MAG: Na/Pi symporter [Chitinophagaceae bacterium]
MFILLKALSGIVIFLLGLRQMEAAFRLLAGRSFKLFLKRQAAHPLRAVAGGALLTAVLQGSSLVNLVILTFTGTGVLTIPHALAVILGTNLGTTLDSWLLVSLGFGRTAEWLGFLLTSVGGLSRLLSSKESKWLTVSQSVMGMGLIYIGLGLLRSAISGGVEGLDFSWLTGYPLFLFFIVGIVLTLLLQSSLATLALVLSLIEINGLTMPAAAALLLGAEIGTTGKLFLASWEGPAVKKRLALGNLLINTVTATLVLLLLSPVLQLIGHLLWIENPLFTLVAFQSFVNVVSLILFFPLLQPLGHFLAKSFRKGEGNTFYLQKVQPDDLALAPQAFRQEAQSFLLHTTVFSCLAFEARRPEDLQHKVHKDFLVMTDLKRYEHLKQQYGTLHQYGLQLQRQLTDVEDIQQVEQLMSVIRNSMYACKSIKDVLQDLALLRNSSHEFKFQYYQLTRDHALSFYGQVIPFLQASPSSSVYPALTNLYEDLVKGYLEDLSRLYHTQAPGKLTEAEISTLINYNRELYTSYKALLLALKDFLLSKPEADLFDDLPGFIR